MAKPTPTQEENDRAAMGEHVVDKEPDGSPPDPNINPPDARGHQPQEGQGGGAQPKQRSMEAGRGQPYTTRSASAARPELKTGSND
jgi:hypothetical protein